MAADARTKQQQGGVDRAAYSIVEFAAAHGMSRAHVYNLMRDGIGPRVFRAGRRTLISAESAAEWRRKMEAASAEAA